MTTSERPAWAIVDTYLDGLVRVNAVGAALELGLVDAIAREPRPDVAELARRIAVDRAELSILIALLQQHDVIARDGEALSFTHDFRRALECRDLLEVKVDYARRVTRAMTTHYADAVREPHRFLGALIDFFVFDARRDFDDALLSASRSWVRYMSTLTRYQVPLLLDAFDFSSARSWIDVGGNNGEQALQICDRHPEVSVTVVDTPVVCALGREHVAGSVRAGRARSSVLERVRFAPTDLAREALPEGQQAAIAKSVLHDWSDAGARRILDAVTSALPAGAPFVIAEFERYDLSVERLPDADVVNLPFLSHLRAPEWYVRELESRGYRDVRVSRLEPLHFMLVTARRGARA